MPDGLEGNEGLLDRASVGEFLERAAADSPTPGGGGIAALAGAAAVSMLEMALNFTVGRPRFQAVESEARAMLAELKRLRERLVELIAADARGYGKVAVATKLRAGSPEEKEVRRAALAAAMREALEPPLEMVRAMRQAAFLSPRVLAVANRNLASDVAVAGAILPGAAKAAALNVWMNISALEAREAAAVSGEVESAIEEIERVAGAVFSQVSAATCPNRNKNSS